jgi:hypothetical protein
MKSVFVVSMRTREMVPWGTVREPDVPAMDGFAVKSPGTDPTALCEVMADAGTIAAIKSDSQYLWVEDIEV